MTNPNIKRRIKLTSYDEMFHIDGSESDHGIFAKEGQPVKEGYYEIPIKDIHTFKNHPFSVMEDEEMFKLVESVRNYGIITPATVRPRPNGEGFELISGHRRRHASILAGRKTMPVVVRNMDDDEAVIMMVDANLQRENVLLSEKAKAYAMKYEALKHQGSRGEDQKGRTLDMMSEESGESNTQIKRIIKIANLIDELLILVDDGKIQLRPAVQLADLDIDAQKMVFDVVKKDKVKITESQAMEIKKMFQENSLTPNALLDFLCANQEVRRRVSLSARKLDDYFTPEVSNSEIELLIIRLLEEWKAQGGSL